MSDPAVSGPWTCQSYSDGSAAVFDSRTMDLLIGDAKAFSASVVVEQLNRDHAEALSLTQRAERAERERAGLQEQLRLIAQVLEQIDHRHVTAMDAIVRIEDFLEVPHD